ncbi:UNVERIFIED_CONTAM: hypothetical protein PYX00_008979 [Menopon gallinae]|uniref:POPDC1-3 domain-containing protein n=1 Tax=Menopon gallinae TaxID=328185 RepID=A0AAW2H9I7_9NEOP
MSYYGVQGLGPSISWHEGGNNETGYGAGNHTHHSSDSIRWCDSWRDAQHVLYQLANVCFLISYSAPSNRIGLVVMHSVLVLGFMLSTGWAWNVVCAPDVFFWNLSFMSLNLLQLFYVVYLMRPVKFNPELEDAYHTLFQPFKISRLTFKKLVSAEFAQIVSLHAGEAYAMQNLTRTDRLGLLLTGKVNVLSDHQFLHPILPCEFLDSPEFESSRANVDEKFKVSIIAATACRYLYWQRSSLEYLFVKETYLATVVTTLIAKDIATKLYAMNNKIITERGSHLDIRLPSITTSIAFINKKRSPLRKFRKDPMTKRQDTGEDNQRGSNVRDRPVKVNFRPANGQPPELEPLKDASASEDVVTWLNSSSRYQINEQADE